MNFLKKYVFYKTDESFEYQDGTYYDIEEHGFYINHDKNEIPIIETLEGFGDYCEDMRKIKTDKELLNYLKEHLIEVEENKYLFEELIEVLKNEN